MNRADELTNRLVDGSLTDAEAGELESLLAADSAALERHLGLLNLEAALRGLRSEFDIAETTIQRIQAARAERTAAAVIAGISARPIPPWGRRPLRRRRMFVAVISVAAALLVAISLILSIPKEPQAPGTWSSPGTDLARITIASGSVEIVSPDGSEALASDQHLAPGQTLRTVGDDSVAIVEFPDHTRLELHPDTAVRLAGVENSDDSVRKLFLVHGRLTATVTGRRTLVSTGAADVVAQSGSFSLCASGLGSARVELTGGDVRIRGGSAKPIQLSPGQAAFVRNDITPISIESPLRIDTMPRDRLEFLGALTLAYSQDGCEVWACSAKQWVRWRIADKSQGALVERLPFFPPTKNDGPVASISTDRRALVACRVDDREDRLVIRNLPDGSDRQVIAVRVTEPRFLCVSPDASWVATTVPKPKNRVRVWDTATGQERFILELANSAFCMAATPDGRFIAVEQSDLGRGTNNRVMFFDSTTGEKSFSLPTKRRQVTSIIFTPDGRYMAAGFNGVVQIWDVQQRQLVRMIEGFERVVTCMAYSPGGNLLAAGTQDGQVWVWSTQTGGRVQVLGTGTRGVRSLAFSPDGKVIATATNKAPVAIWDVGPKPVKPEL